MNNKWNEMDDDLSKLIEEREIATALISAFISQKKDSITSSIVESGSVIAEKNLSQLLTGTYRDLKRFRRITTNKTPDSQLYKDYIMLQKSLKKVITLINNEEVYDLLLSLELMFSDFGEEKANYGRENSNNFSIRDLRYTLNRLDLKPLAIKQKSLNKSLTNARKTSLFGNEAGLFDSAKKSPLRESYIIAHNIYHFIHDSRLQSPIENRLCFDIAHEFISFLKEKDSDFKELQVLSSPDYFNEFKR